MTKFHYTKNKKDIHQVFERYSNGSDLTITSLCNLLKEIFSDNIASINVPKIADCLFKIGETSLTVEKFELIWLNFINPILKPVTAFIIVDVQNDFISGSLALSNCPAEEDGAEVVPVINEVLENVRFDHVFYSYDWHPKNHISFHPNLSIHKDQLLQPCMGEWERVQIFEQVLFDGKPPLQQKMWPVHCVQGSEGAKLHKDLKIVEGAIKVYKGSDPKIDSYSAFWDNGDMMSTGLLDQLKERQVTDVYICGLATDYCVNFTAVHACKHDFRVIIVEEACRGVDKNGIADTKKKLNDLGALIVSTRYLYALMSGQEIPSTLALVTAQNFKRKFLRV